MKQFREMIKLIKTEGVVHVGSFADPDWTRKLEDYTWAESIFEACEVFVFEPNREELISPRNLTEWDDAPFVKIEDATIDPPFPVFSVELAGGMLSGFKTSNIITRVETLGAVKCMIVCDLRAFNFNRQINFVDYHGKKIDSDYLIFAYMMLPGGPEHGTVFVACDNENPLVADFLQRINLEATGVIEKPERITWKNRKNRKKKEHIIKTRTFIVAPKQYKKSDNPKFRDVNWTHRWNVRGHWRKVDGIGKDRQGDYSEQGRTWVKNQTRGPEGLPLIKKQHIIKSEPTSS